MAVPDPQSDRCLQEGEAAELIFVSKASPNKKPHEFALMRLYFYCSPIDGLPAANPQDAMPSQFTMVALPAISAVLF